jgi:flagellar P-ring protein precursor FlgI
MKIVKNKCKFIFILFTMIFLHSSFSDAARIKDITNLQGVRENQLIGYGIVIGLAGTGDSSTNIFFSMQTIASMLKKLGLTVPQNEIASLKFKNMATVMITAELPPFARAGSRIDVLISSLGDAKSLQGGTLLLTPLKAANGEVYAVAQGSVSIGGFEAGGAARGVQKNHLTVGRVVSGALIEKEIPFDFENKESLRLALGQPDFTTVNRVATTINKFFKKDIAFAKDAGTVDVLVPDKFKKNVVKFVASMETLEVSPDTAARIIIDERTGTIIVGENVRISKIAVSHGSLTIKITEEPIVEQPKPLSEGETTIVPRTRITVDEGEDRLLVLPEGTNLGEVVTALNAIGVSPRDLIAILQSIKAAGALQGELILI